MFVALWWWIVRAFHHSTIRHTSATYIPVTASDRSSFVLSSTTYHSLSEHHGKMLPASEQQRCDACLPAAKKLRVSEHSPKLVVYRANVCMSASITRARSISQLCRDRSAMSFCHLFGIAASMRRECHAIPGRLYGSRQTCYMFLLLTVRLLLCLYPPECTRLMLRVLCLRPPLRPAKKHLRRHANRPSRNG